MVISSTPIKILFNILTYITVNQLNITKLLLSDELFNMIY